MGSVEQERLKKQLDKLGDSFNKIGKDLGRLFSQAGKTAAAFKEFAEAAAKEQGKK